MPRMIVAATPTQSAVIVSGDGSAIVGPSSAGSEKYMSTTIRT